MLNPIQKAEAIHSATYVDNYIDSVENLPDDVQRHLSRIRDIDVQYRNFLRDVDHYYDLWKSLPLTDSLTVRRRALMLRMHQCLIKAQELGDDKMHIVTQLQDLIDCKTRQLDMDQKNLDIKCEEENDDMVLQAAIEYGTPATIKRSRSQSPTRGVTEASSTVILNGGGGAVGSGSGGSTPNSERSGHTSNGAVVSGGAHISVGHPTNSSMCVSDSQRSANKRSRRRHENTGSNSCSTELACNESNSANEAGSIGGSGPDKLTTKSSNIGNSQKKSTSQSQSGATGTMTVQSIAGASMVSGGGSASTSVSTSNNSGKKKKRKARGGQTSSAQISAREETPPPDPIDPDEPTYCICNQISFGEMILCDNDLCPIEWFHFSCVSLVFKPKGRWYCPNCRGDRPNVMKPKAQFLKELERYNKEKEERT